MELPQHWTEADRELFETIRRDRCVHEPTRLVVLVQAVELARRADDCRRRIDADGAAVVDRFGKPKPHPLLLSERKARADFAKLVATFPCPSPFQRDKFDAAEKSSAQTPE